MAHPVATEPMITLDLPEHRPLAVRSRQVGDRIGNHATFMGLAPLPGEFAAIEGRGATDWVLFSAETDPQLLTSKFDIPAHARAQLRQVARAAVQWDRLFIVHELTVGSLERLRHSERLSPASVARVLPRTTDRRVPRLANDAAAAFSAIGRTVGIAVVAAPLALGLAVAAPLALGLAMSTAGGLDPAVVGAITAPGQDSEGDLCTLWLLASWS